MDALSRPWKAHNSGRNVHYMIHTSMFSDAFTKSCLLFLFHIFYISCSGQHHQISTLKKNNGHPDLQLKCFYLHNRPVTPGVVKNWSQWMLRYLCSMMDETRNQLKKRYSILKLFVNVQRKTATDLQMLSSDCRTRICKISLNPRITYMSLKTAVKRHE